MKNYLPTFDTIIPRKKINLNILLWILNFVMLLRLIFASRGIIDYIDHKSFLNERKEKLNDLIKENEDLTVTINVIQNDKKYQKKLVRDQLGFISPEEYIIYFVD